MTARAIPSVAYTDPETAWMGLTEDQAREQKLAINKAIFPRDRQRTRTGSGARRRLHQMLFDQNSGRLLGAGMVGLHAGDPIAETVLALEMGADAEDTALSVHPHPTLSQTVAFATEIADGSITDLYVPQMR